MKKRRLFVSVDFPPEVGGIQNYLYGLVSNLTPENTYVLTSNRIGNELYDHFDQEQKFKIYRSKINSGLGIHQLIIQTLSMYKQIKMICSLNKIDEIHFGNILPVGLAGLLLYKKINFIVYVHGLDILHAYNSKYKKLMLNLVLKKSSKIIANSNNTKKLLINKYGVDDEKIQIINPGLSIPPSSETKNIIDVRKKHNISKHRRIVLTVARLHQRKGHDKVIEAINLLKKESPDILYVVCGSGPYEEKLKEQVDRLKLGEHVKFVGQVTNNELHSWYIESELFIMASRQLEKEGDIEGYGIVFLEANYYSLPVLGGNSGGIPDAIKDGRTGFLVDPNDIIDIKNKIEYLLRNKLESKKMGEEGKYWVEKECLWKHRVKQLQ